MSLEQLLEILQEQVKPALGCTEPGAVAYGVALAKELLGTRVEDLRIKVDKNVLKNGMNVGIPGTEERGIVFAAALALVIGKSEYVLEALRDITPASLEAATAIVKAGIIKLDLEEKVDCLYISVEAQGEGARSQVIIKNDHTNVVFKSKNGHILLAREDGSLQAPGPGKNKYKIKNYTIRELIEFVRNVPGKEVAFIQAGIDMNMNLARIALRDEIGMGLGKYFFQRAKNVFDRAKAYTVAAAEARMSGYPLPVMTSAGSGNHGLVAITPLAAIGTEMGISRENITRSIALSHLLTIYVKVHTGTLSPVCGCGIAAGIGCTAGLTYMLGGSNDQIRAAINNMAAGISGMICDGAKLGCSAKLAIAVDAAVDAANMALKDIYIPFTDGILAEAAEETVKNMALVSRVGMASTDEVILAIMLKRSV
ncbi:MAG: serine dehydratase subunit alpha family protein [Firmicutes bacterium]|nr:serine dehydratase subunit alpha family protein [Bacillota bacterium]